jgi:hypothetical protein
MGSILIRIAVAIVCAAIGRGIVAAFHLDTLVARTISELWQEGASFSPEARVAIAWMLSGLIGLIGLTSWLVLHIDERLQDLLRKRPTFGSLPNVNFTVNVARNITTGKVDAEMAVEIKNVNDFVVGYRGHLEGEMNDKPFIAPDGSERLPIHGYAHPAIPTSLILKFYDVPQAPTGRPPLSGTIKYDLAYFAAPSGKRTRRTMKRIAFERLIPFRGIPGQTGQVIQTLYREQKEE